MPARTAPLQKIRKAEQQQLRLPMPVGGLNFVDNTLSIPATDCYLVDNFQVRPYGLEIRKGWKYWVPEASSFADEVRTILAFNGGNPLNNRLFCSPAVSTGAIYNITTPNTAPVLVLTPSTAPTFPGEWYYTQYVTPGGSFLCAVSENSGYYTFSSAVGWVEVVTGTGAGKVQFPSGDTTTTKDFAYVWAWKNRLWFLKRNSPVAYYLPINSISGAVQSFDFGPQLVHGGPMNFGCTWTYDSGAGLDDGLILTSVEGDLLIYQGTDPASASTFQLKGSWYCGRLPAARRGWCLYGGDTLILTEYGLVSVTDLVSGRLHTPQITGTMGYKINTTLARLITRDQGQKYWFLLPYPPEEFLLVGTPVVSSDWGLRQSYVMNSITNGWSSISQMDILCAELYEGRLIFGTRTGAVCHGFTGYRDGDSSDGATLGDEVTGRIMTSFNGFGNDTMNKRMLRIKLYGLVDGVPSFYATFREEYDLNQAISTPAPAQQVGYIWDVALWDEALWSADTLSLRRWYGVAAFGKKLSLQLGIRGVGRTLLTDYESLYETGINL